MNDTIPLMRSFDEYGLIAENLSNVDSRSLVNPFVDGKFPVFISPMTCITDETCWEKFSSSKFIPIYPVRYDNIQARLMHMCSGDWVAFSRDEFNKILECEIERPNVDLNNAKICIDTANGHMKSLYDLVRKAKKHFPGITLMIGNVCNPTTYIECCLAGVDFVRVSVGTGTGCTTSVKLGFHASLPWLLEEINKIKDNLSLCKINFVTKVIADGGIDDTAKMIKAFALGADYVMVGGMIARTDTAAGITSKSIVGADPNIKTYRKYYGQASNAGQIDRFGEIRSTPEGVERWLPVQCTFEELEKEIEGCIRSAMSYANAFTLNEFIGRVKYNYQTPHEFECFNKRSR